MIPSAIRSAPEPLRGPWRRLGFGLATVLGLRRLGFFIPYRYAGTVATGAAIPPYAPMEAAFAAAAAGFTAVLADIGRFAADLERIGGEPPPAPRWQQDWFPPLDAAAAYALIRGLKPARIVEVGSGHSTRFFARAVADGGFPCRLTAIDPAPRASLAGLAGRDGGRGEGVGLTLIRSTVQEAGLAPFAPIAPGDVIAIDSSHILVPGTDVDFLLNRVLPVVPAGTIVHVHDIFLPDGYPAAWSWRGYNEQQAVAVMISGGGWEPLWSSRFVATRLASWITADRTLPSFLAGAAVGSSLWLRKRAGHK